MSEKKEFKAWLKKVDRLLYQKIHMHCDEVPDQLYWDNFVEKTTPKEMAEITYKDTLRYMGFDPDED